MLNKKNIKKLKYIDYFNNQKLIDINNFGDLNKNELDRIFYDTEKFFNKNKIKEVKEVIPEEEIEGEDDKQQNNLNIILLIVLIFAGIFLYIQNSKSSTTNYLNQIQR